MSFIEVKPLTGGGRFHIAAAQIAEVDAIAERVTTLKGRDLRLADPAGLERLIGGGLVRGVAEADGAFVAVPLTAIDHVVDRWDDATQQWVAIVTTARGFRFLPDCAGRAMLGMDSEVYGSQELREQAARLRGEVQADAAAMAAVEAAERAVRKTA